MLAHGSFTIGATYMSTQFEDRVGEYFNLRNATLIKAFVGGSRVGHDYQLQVTLIMHEYT